MVQATFWLALGVAAVGLGAYAFVFFAQNVLAPGVLWWMPLAEGGASLIFGLSCLGRGIKELRDR